MSFEEWLYFELAKEDIINEDDVAMDELTPEFLDSCTDLDDYDIEEYRAQYDEYCRYRGFEPVYDRL